MEFKQLKYDFLKHAKEFCFSENYSVFCTGKRAFICDRKLNLLHTVDKLSYVYQANISPDETQLLLISLNNIFYLVDLRDFSVNKQIVRGKYSGDLDGRGCWSFDSGLLYFAVCNPKTINSALRCYNLADHMSFKDWLAEKYWFVDIKPVAELNKYLLIGTDRKKQDLDRIDCWTLIFFDGASFDEYPIRNVEVSEDCISSAEYEATTNTIILYGLAKTFRCDLKGKILEDMSLREPEAITVSFSDVFTDVKLESDDLGELKKLSASFGMEHLSIDDSIYKASLSLDGTKYYVGTHIGLLVIDVKTKEVLGKKKIDYGVQNIKEIAPNLIFVSTWDCVKVFEIIE